ncbi:MAG TPA: hypothetical protein VGG72_15745 [Bryobacteraceae bacterium]|jgi:hypothetical protein
MTPTSKIPKEHEDEDPSALPDHDDPLGDWEDEDREIEPDLGETEEDSSEL